MPSDPGGGDGLLPAAGGGDGHRPEDVSGGPDVCVRQFERFFSGEIDRGSGRQTEGRKGHK